MFASSAEYRHAPRSGASAYHLMGVETGIASATPHQLVAMLFDAFAESLLQARGAIRSGQIEQRGRCLARASRILNEGLRGGLNLREGGTLAADLNDLYAYVSQRLTQANVRGDEAALNECQQLIQPLREAWASIGASADAVRN
jgi:flagellar protein FliS